jgi:pimeloyl-ACP methyl ester carboxylesterase
VAKFKKLLCGFLALVFSTPLLAFSELNIMQPATYKIDTSVGSIAISDSKPNGSENTPTVIFIHGHLCNRGFFIHQIQSPLLAKYRLISLDLPGYGESSPPANPEETYSFPGFTEAVSEVVRILKLKNIVIVGWSLGGHVALELTSRIDGLKGLLITGTPPIEVSADGLSRGFRIVNPKILECFGKGNLSQEEAELMATICGYDGSKEKQFIVDAIFQSDEGAKTIYPQSIARGIGQNELEIVKKWPHPIAVIAGQEDIGINTDYIINEVDFRNLWKGKVHMINGAGHAVHMEKPQEFNAILSEFLEEIWSDK